MTSLHLKIDPSGQPQFVCRRPVRVRVRQTPFCARRYHLEAEGILYPDRTFEITEYVFVRTEKDTL